MPLLLYTVFQVPQYAAELSQVSRRGPQLYWVWPSAVMGVALSCIGCGPQPCMSVLLLFHCRLQAQVGGSKSE